MIRSECRRRRRGAPVLRSSVPLLMAALATVTMALAPSAQTARTEGAGCETPVSAGAMPIVPMVEFTRETEDPAEYLAKTIYGEARGCSTTEQAAVVWCVLNRVDDESGLWPDDIVGVVTQPRQFHGYDPGNPVLPELLAVAKDVLARWEMEDSCVGDVGRVLPKEYTYFSGDGRHNYFRTEWDGGTTWDWGLESPYLGG